MPFLKTVSFRHPDNNKKRQLGVTRVAIVWWFGLLGFYWTICLSALILTTHDAHLHILNGMSAPKASKYTVHIGRLYSISVFRCTYVAIFVHNLLPGIRFIGSFCHKWQRSLVCTTLCPLQVPWHHCVKHLS